MHEYPSVLCWTADFYAHSKMIILGACASVLNIVFLTASVYMVVKLPEAMRSGNVRFLHTCTFLFIRSCPGMASFVLVLLFRNLFVAMIPVIPNAPAQVILMIMILASYTAVQIRVFL